MKQKGLGRGLDAIFGSEHLDARLKPMTEMAEISVSAIFPNPTQPRTEFDEEALEELADSIRTLGVIQPITVKRTDDGRYLIISGERRWRAARKAGLESLPISAKWTTRTCMLWPWWRTSSAKTSTPSKSPWECSG